MWTQRLQFWWADCVRHFWLAHCLSCIPYAEWCRRLKDLLRTGRLKHESRRRHDQCFLISFQPWQVFQRSQDMLLVRSKLHYWRLSFGTFGSGALPSISWPGNTRSCKKWPHKVKLTFLRTQRKMFENCVSTWSKVMQWIETRNTFSKRHDCSSQGLNKEPFVFRMRNRLIASFIRDCWFGRRPKYPI